MFEFEENLGISAKIKVVGIGGGGGNSIKTMMKEQIDGVDFVAINTDVQSLRENDAMIKIQIGTKLTRGLGSGSNPNIGKEAALEDENLIRESLQGSDMIFITAGMGGGTGTGAAPVIGKIARDLGILTVGVVTKPFSFEGKKRQRQADEGIAELKECVDTLICLPNDNLLNLVGKDTPIVDSFKMVDQVVLQAVRGISDLITIPGLINLDFADIKTIMTDSGLALMGTGAASGENRALNAAKLAITSPLLENVSVSGATGIVLNITGTSSMTLFEVNEASKLIQQECDEDVNIIFGTVIDDQMGDALRVTVIATGFGGKMDEIKSDALARTQRSKPRNEVWPQRPQQRERPDSIFNKQQEPMAHLSTAQDEPASKYPQPQSQDNIRDVFNEMNQEPIHQPVEETAFAPAPESPSLFSFEEEQKVTPQPKTSWGEKSVSENLSEAMANENSIWGEEPEQPQKDLTPTSNGITRKRAETGERPDLQKMMSKMDSNEFDSDEYDIPAFIRRRAD